MSTTKLWQRILQSASLTIATSGLLRSARARIFQLPNAATIEARSGGKAVPPLGRSEPGVRGPPPLGDPSLGVLGFATESVVGCFELEEFVGVTREARSQNRGHGGLECIRQATLRTAS